VRERLGAQRELAHASEPKPLRHTRHEARGGVRSSVTGSFVRSEQSQLSADRSRTRKQTENGASACCAPSLPHAVDGGLRGASCHAEASGPYGRKEKTACRGQPTGRELLEQASAEVADVERSIREHRFSVPSRRVRPREARWRARRRAAPGHPERPAQLRAARRAVPGGPRRSLLPVDGRGRRAGARPVVNLEAGVSGPWAVARGGTDRTPGAPRQQARR
jgi:hypothetical protein